MGRERSFEAVLFVLLMVASILVFRNASPQESSWSYPFFSGAEHLDGSLAWRYSAEGYRRFYALPLAEQVGYDFSAEKNDTLVPYAFNNMGYVFVVWAAKTVFPFLSNIQATVALQCLVHILTTLVVAFGFERRFARVAFVLLYGANPLVVHIVTLPFYYFWQVVPALGFLAVAQRGGRSRMLVASTCVLFVLSYLIRPSVLPLVLFAISAAVLQARAGERLFRAGLALCVVVVIASVRLPAEPWHTMYVGLGAYDNPYMQGLSDENGFLLYSELKNVRIERFLPDGNFYDEHVRRDYFDTLRKRYLEILRTDYGLVVKNALLNLAQSFSFGYLPKYPFLRWFGVLTGLVVAAILLWSRQFLLVMAVLASSIGFVLYYPPIPAYMFGSYVLLAVGLVRALETRMSPRSLPRSAQPT